MTYKLYQIEVDDGGEFDVAFIQFTKTTHRAAARLIKRLEAFAKNRKREGEFFRGSAKMSIFVIPFQETLDKDNKEPGLFALVNDDSKMVTPLRFIHPSQRHNWQQHIKWAENFLNI